MTKDTAPITDDLSTSADQLGDPDAAPAKTDPAATGEAYDQDAEATAQATAVVADTAGEDDASADEVNADAVNAEADGGKVDRREHDGVMGNLRDERSRRQAAEARLAELERAEADRQAALAAASQRDYAAELTALEDQWENGDITEFKDFQKQRDDILVAKARDETNAEIQQRDAERKAEENKQAWEAAIAEFLSDDANKKFDESPILSNALVQAVNVVLQTKPTISYKEALSEAVIELEMGFGMPKDTPQAATRAERRASQAVATASGAAIPPSPASGGGVGARGTGAGVDLTKVGRDKWGDVPQHVRDEALGKPAD